MSVIHSQLLNKHQVLSLVEGGLCSLKEASERLGLSYRQTRRWYGRYRETCGSLIDFGRTRSRGGGWNKTSNEVVKRIVSLKQKYPRMNNPHIADTLFAEHQNSLSASTVKRVLCEKQIYHPVTHTRRVFTRFEPESYGERLQMDTTSGAWMQGHRLIYLIVVLDEFSRRMVGWKWVDADSAWNNMCVLHSVFCTFGRPKMLYTDNASMFKTIRHGRSIHQNHKEEGYETEIQRAMRELGVTMFSHKPYEPQSKGKIERLNRFIQERFVANHTCKNLTEMNTAFEKWVDWYNDTHVNRTTGMKAKDRHTPSVWTPVLAEELNRALCFKTTRKIDKCNAFRFEGSTYTLTKDPILVHRTVGLEYTPTTISVFHQNERIQQFPRPTN